MEIKKFIKKTLLGGLLFCGSFALIVAALPKADYRRFLSGGVEASDIEIIKTDKYGNPAIKIKSNRNLKIMQISDLHIGYGKLSREADEKAFETVKKLVESEKPDLIIVTGDFIYFRFIQTLTKNAENALKSVLNLMESFKIPYAFVLGNHDDEGNLSREEIGEILENPELEYSLFSCGPKSVPGVGNYVIDILNSDEKLNSSLFLLDSGAHVGGRMISGYESITAEQSDWYEGEVRKIEYNEGKIIPSHMFFHIPHEVFKEAWEAYKANDPNLIYHFGGVEEFRGRISVPEEKSDIFDRIVKLGSTKTVFCGHNHMNDFSLTYKGVRLTFGKSIDYLAYPTAGFKSKQRGATMLEIKPDGEFFIKQIPYDDLK